MHPAADLPARLDALRRELADLAFVLEQRGRRDAADLAGAVAVRLGEICGEEAGGDVGEIAPPLSAADQSVR